MRTRRYPKRRIFILDEIALIAAFFLTLFIRFGSGALEWYDIFDGLYVSFLIVLCLLRAVIFMAYDSRKKSIFVSDPVEVLVNVIKSRIVLIVLALFYLYVTQRGELSSRLVLGLLFVTEIILDYAIRMIYRGLFLRNNGVTEESIILELYEPFETADEIARHVNDGGYDAVLLHEKMSVKMPVRESNVAGNNPVNSEVYAAKDTFTGENDGENALYGLCHALEKHGIRTFRDITNGEYHIRSGIISDINGYAAIPAYIRSERFELFGINYAIARTEEAVLHVMRHVKELSGEYICFSNVHTSVMARENADYRQILNEAAFTFPDGNPIAVLQQKKGLIGAERVAGPDFMEHMFRDTQDGQISHYFYGASQETIDALKEKLLKKYPGINIKGMYSPPYRELTAEEDIADIERINSSGADIVWVGLGAPKQEKWMNAHKGRLNGVMLGVGAGFDFHAGTIKRAPKWIQKVGLEWLYRLFQDPERLFKRYFVTNVKFFWYLIVGK